MTTATAPNNRVKGGSEQSPLDSILSATEQQMLIRPELLQMRMENETIMSECRVRPRDMKHIREQLQSLLDEFPDFGDEAVYCKPVGREEGSNQQKFAKGLSIRAAEALAEAYGYNRVRADVTKIDDFTVKIDATFTDFQTGRIWQDGGIVSKFYTAKNKSRTTYSDDRFYNVVVKAEKSKYLREVILRSVNSALKAWFEALCAKVAGSRITPADIDKTVSAWAKLGVKLEHLEEVVGKQRSMGWVADDLSLLRGIWNAIRDGETTLREAFGIDGESKPQQKQATTGPVKSGDLANPKAADAQPTVAPFDQYVTELAATDQQSDATKVYDRWFGPESTVEFTAEQNTEATKLRDARIADIKGSRGAGSNKQKQLPGA